MSTTTKVQIDTKTFIRFWLVIIGFGLVGLLLHAAAPGLLVVAGALFIAIAISPLVRKLANIFPGKSRGFATALAYIIVVGFITALIAIVAPTIVNESVKFASNLPSVVDGATSNLKFINDFGESIGVENLRGQIIDWLRTFTGSLIGNDIGTVLTNSVTAIGSFMASIILMLVLAFFMLTEGPKIVRKFWSNFKSGEAKKAEHVVYRLTRVVSQYVTNAITVSLINGCATVVASFIICLIFGISPGLALPFGLITGVASLIPMFGSFIGGALVALLLGFNQLGAGIAFLVYTIVYLQIEANIISPKVQGRGLNLPALAVLSAVTIGIYMFGIPGAIISIPIAGCIKVLFEEYSADLMDDGKINGSDIEKKPIDKKPDQKPDAVLIAEQKA